MLFKLPDSTDSLDEGTDIVGLLGLLNVADQEVNLTHKQAVGNQH